MAIIRQKRKERFSIIDNRVIEDKRLSWGARGLLEYMLSKPDDWKFYMSELISHSDNDGRDKTYGYMNELKKYGYVTRKQNRNSNGKFGNQDLIVTDSPLTGFPDTAKPDAGKPDTVNPQLLNTEYKTNTDLTNTDIDDDDARTLEADIPQTEPQIENAPFALASQANINVNSGLHMPIFVDFIDTLGSPVVCWAIRKTADSASHPNWSYLLTVMKNLEANGVRTVEGAEKLSERHKAENKQRYKKQNGHQHIEEPLPDWAGKEYKRPSKEFFDSLYDD